MSRYDTVIFDLDGTLLDTLEDLCDAVNAALVRFGYPERSLDEVRQFVGNGVLRLMTLAVPGGQEASDFQEVFAYFKEYYAIHSQDKTRLYDGIYELVEHLSQKGIRMAIVSNKFHTAVCHLSEQYFGDLIPVAIGENEAAGISRKPAPDSVFEAMRQLGSVKERTVYVGDSEVDYATAENAGLNCLLVSWGFRDRALLESFNPEKILDSAAQLEAYLIDQR